MKTSALLSLATAVAACESDSTCLLQLSASIKREESSIHDKARALWEGFDVQDTSEFGSERRKSGIDRKRLLLAGATRLQIMGLYNSGTNLAETLLKYNFKDDLQITHDNEEVLDCKFWKHSSLAVLKEQYPQALATCPGRVLGVAIVRNPLSWLASMKGEAYDLYACNEGADWLTRSCSFGSETPSYLARATYTNIEDIWNNWVRDYSHLEDFGFTLSNVVRYEDLVQYTRVQLKAIGKVIGSDLPPDGVVGVQHNKSPASDNDPDGREKALEKLKDKSYLEEFSSAELADACSRLDKELMAKYQYDDCDGIA